MTERGAAPPDDRLTLELGAPKLSSLNVIPRRLSRGFLEALFEVGDTSRELRALTLECGLELLDPRLGLRQTLLELLALGGVLSIQLWFLLSGLKDPAQLLRLVAQAPHLETFIIRRAQQV